MKTLLQLIGWVLVLGCFSCQKDQVLDYAAKDNVYFDFDDAKTTSRDSILFTFAYTPEKALDTLFLPIRISGVRVAHQRKFKVTVVAEGTTAQPALHYQPLAEYYTIPADSGSFQLPLVLLNQDTALQNKSVAINLTLGSTDDFGVSFPKLIGSRVIFSSRLEKPIWWDLWSGQLGEYSRVKHEFYLIAVGHIDLLSNYDGDAYLQIPKNLYLIDKLRRFVEDPFGWVAGEENKGYVLTPRTDGDYDFYHENNPGKKNRLVKNASDGKYYFMNENGVRITIN